MDITSSLWNYAAKAKTLLSIPIHRSPKVLFPTLPPS
jgi:hypothetical protein